MRLLLSSRTWYLIGGAGLLTAVSIGYFIFHKNTASEVITAQVERGVVTELVSVSGLVEAKNTAELAFPTVDRVTEVFVDEGSVVEAGEVLATLGSATLVAERSEAAAALRLANAQLSETVAGASEETRTLAATKLANAEANLERVQQEEALKVENARRTLLSSQLEARPVDPEEDATAPIVSGTYRCEGSGSYTLDIYSAGGTSGFAIRYSGLEGGTTEAYVDHPGALGTCGLDIQLTAGDFYGNSRWTITVPNTQASSYVSLKNAYELAQQQAANAIAAAENTLALAREEAGVTTAAARSEVVSQRRAAVAGAQARLAAIDARLADRSIVAPFSGTITDVRILPGETATAAPVITLLAEDAFELTARIPEIDVTRVGVNQAVVATFDAKTDAPQRGRITYVSPLASQIDGVAYFEAIITLDETPDWLRAGLNADVDITIDEATETLRLPKRFIEGAAGTYTVTTLAAGARSTTPVEVLFIGNDGYAAISGLAEGTVVVAP